MMYRVIIVALLALTLTISSVQCAICIKDRCKSSPCLNGGSCQEEDNQVKGYCCQCPPEYIGTYCEVSTVCELEDPCNPSPCLNNGTCQPTASNGTGYERFKCMCTDGFRGFDCAVYEGNNNLAALTVQKQYRLRVDLGDWSNNYRYAEYDNFRVGDASTKFRLSVINYMYTTGDAGDSLTNTTYFGRVHANMMFSTYDQDNDMTAGSCASGCRGAWWYNSCYHSNLNGEYNGTSGTGVNWFSWLSSSYSLRFTEMKFRSTN